MNAELPKEAANQGKLRRVRVCVSRLIPIRESMAGTAKSVWGYGRGRAASQVSCKARSVKVRAAS
jgi:hypothetical protein